MRGRYVAPGPKTSVRLGLISLDFLVVVFTYFEGSFERHADNTPPQRPAFLELSVIIDAFENAVLWDEAVVRHSRTFDEGRTQCALRYRLALNSMIAKPRTRTGITSSSFFHMGQR
jgi:hypothetical protein